MGEQTSPTQMYQVFDEPLIKVMARLYVFGEVLAKRCPDDAASDHTRLHEGLYHLANRRLPFAKLVEEVADALSAHPVEAVRCLDAVGLAQEIAAPVKVRSESDPL